VDAHGNVAAACSSGGVALKHPGRVGQVSFSVLICVCLLLRGNMNLLHDCSRDNGYGVGDIHTTRIMNLLAFACFTYVSGCDIWVWMLGNQWNSSCPSNCIVHIWLWGIPCTYHACT
jgi:hypothetical protein